MSSISVGEVSEKYMDWFILGGIAGGIIHWGIEFLVNLGKSLKCWANKLQISGGWVYVWSFILSVILSLVFFLFNKELVIFQDLEMSLRAFK